MSACSGRSRWSAHLRGLCVAGCAPDDQDALATLEDEIVIPAGTRLAARFRYVDFAAAGAPPLALVDDAALVRYRPAAPRSYLRLNAAEVGATGAAWWYPARVPVIGGFVAHFSFRFRGQGADGGLPPWADGLAFVVQDHAPDAIGVAGCEIGYGGIPRSVIVELDSFTNTNFCGLDDPEDNHVAVHVGGDPHEIPGWNASLGPDVILKDGAVHEVAVAYFPGELSVYVDDLTTPRLTVPLSLGAHGAAGGDGAAWVGFTAATAVAFERHEITRFSMSSAGAAACGQSIVVEPRERRTTAVDLGATSRTFILRSDALAGRARTVVRYEGQVIHDTGCSELARATVPVHFAGSSTVVTTDSWTCGGALGPTGHSVGCLRSPGALVTGADTDSAPEEIAAVPQNVRPAIEMYVGRLGQANDLITSRCDLAVNPRNCTDILTGQTCTKPCNYEGSVAQSVGAASAYGYWFLRGPLDAVDPRASRWNRGHPPRRRAAVRAAAG